MRKRLSCLLCLLGLLPLLSGCMPSGAYTGKVLFELIYPSGHSRDAYTRDELTPVEGTPYQLRQQGGADGQAAEESDLQVLDADGTVIHTFPGLGSDTLRGESAGGGTAWLCTERWQVPHLNGYVSGKLAGGELLLADMESGAILFQQELEENELYLTSAGARCYFYHPGREGEERYFGLYTTPQENARIYYRDVDNWQEPVRVHTFDFVEWPDRLPDDLPELRIRFYLQEHSIIVALSTYELTDRETGAWEYIERERVTVDLSQAGPL